ncbi:cysteine--tRNA ligase [Erythrobacter litoralis]|uniref:Cysteine--tRNA ligase n=1 Tax=Erythrobacter litoralis (strain HTCC2594) TaxID=314225 RepID=Q2N912_ERYLH|nr:cysteine--tRNA ligase [Erythrobacter litoralis]ABC63829.1 cysteinyl-tRNA synthetase [Erythrobacter litoralis HTCC2594]
MTTTPLKLFNSLTRSLEEFQPIHPGEARVYTCGPTVYNYQHIGNMRAYIFADTLGRTLSWKGFDLKHVINITDVGHLTSDADAGDDKMEKAAAREGKSAWDIARYYQQVFEADLDRLNIRKPEHPRATDYVESMIAWAKSIEAKHCYELDSGLYFDVSTVPEYGRLARAVTDEGEGRIDEVEGKRNAADFAIWRKTPPGETRQMEWDSPWGKGAPGWHLECSVMSAELLGHPFDIHTGGIDHREIHHPNEIAQNQAHNCSPDSGAKIWMHNNFLIDRRGKMSKSSGEFLTLQALVDRGFHPLAYRMLCLQAHYRSELEFTWEGLEAALVRLKRMVMALETLKARHAELVSASMPNSKPWAQMEAWTLKQVQGDDWGKLGPAIEKFGTAIADDLNTAISLTAMEDLLATKKIDPAKKLVLASAFDAVLGFDLLNLSRTDLRTRPATAEISEAEIEAAFAERKEARAAKDFARSDAIRDDLAAKGVEVMDGDPLGWEWKRGT